MKDEGRRSGTPVMGRRDGEIEELGGRNRTRETVNTKDRISVFGPFCTSIELSIAKAVRRNLAPE
jgi:hypothetical protein